MLKELFTKIPEQYHETIKEWAKENVLEIHSDKIFTEFEVTSLDVSRMFEYHKEKAGIGLLFDLWEEETESVPNSPKALNHKLTLYVLKSSKKKTKGTAKKKEKKNGNS